MSMTKKPYLLTFLLIATIENFSTEVMLPAFPAIQKALHVSKSQVQLTLTLFLLGFALSPLLLGPIADKTGRRRLLLLMMGLFNISVFFQMSANTIEVIQLTRLIQGFTCGGFFVINQAMIRESYPIKTLPFITSLVAISWALISIFSPLLGGYIQTWYSWRVSFFSIWVYITLILGFLYFTLPETLPDKRKTTHVRMGLKYIGILLKQKIFVLSAIFASFTYALIYIFYAVSPFLFQDMLGVSVIQYAWILFSTGTAYLVGALLNRFACHFCYTQRRLQIGLFGVAACICFLSLNILMDKETVLDIIIPMVLMMMFAGAVFPNALAIAMGVQEKQFATASALYCSIQFMGCALGTFITSKLFVNALYPIAIVMLVIVSCFPVMFRQYNKLGSREW